MTRATSPRWSVTQVLHKMSCRASRLRSNAAVRLLQLLRLFPRTNLPKALVRRWIPWRLQELLRLLLRTTLPHARLRRRTPFVEILTTALLLFLVAQFLILTTEGSNLPALPVLCIPARLQQDWHTRVLLQLVLLCPMAMLLMAFLPLLFLLLRLLT